MANKGAVKKAKKILHATFLQTSKAMYTLYAMFINHFGHKGPRSKARPLLMAAFYELKGRCFRFLPRRQVCRKEARLFEIFRCRDPKERQVEGGSDASRSLAWAVSFVKIKFRVCGDVSIGKAKEALI